MAGGDDLLGRIRTAPLGGGCDGSDPWANTIKATRRKRRVLKMAMASLASDNQEERIPLDSPALQFASQGKRRVKA